MIASILLLAINICLTLSLIPLCSYLPRSLLAMTLTKAFPPPRGQVVLVRCQGCVLYRRHCMLTCVIGRVIQSYRVCGRDYWLQNLSQVEGAEGKAGYQRLLHGLGFMWSYYMCFVRCCVLEARCSQTKNECRV